MTEEKSEFEELQGNPSEIYLNRHKKLLDLMQNEEIDILAVNPGSTLFYLTGLEFHLTERPILCLVSHTSPVIFILPELESGKLEQLSFSVQSFIYSEDPVTWESIFNEAFQSLDLEHNTVAVEHRNMRILESRYISASTSKAQIVNAEEILSRLRMIKDQEEISAIKKAVNIAQKAFLETIPKIRNDVSERAIAADFIINLLRFESEPEFPFFPIIQSGPNSAVPHLHPTDRLIKSGDPIVFDWGARFRGYISDITRTIFLGKPSNEMFRVFQVVLDANTAAKNVAGPDIPAEIVDNAARDVIEKAGFGKYFIHRTGHGIGLDGHENPYIRAGNKMLLKPGMTFTIEPGIYLPGIGGVRIEDDVLITETGIESLSSLPYEF